MPIAHLRTEYQLFSLLEDDTDADPRVQFMRWFEQAREAGLADPNAMTLATVGADGRPSLRVVLLKDADAAGFTWYTNYQSRKGRDLAVHPHAALQFHWAALERQVHIEGTVERVSAADSDAYFAIRPLASRVGALASHQSAPIDGRTELEAQYAAAALAAGEAPARPAHWGGLRLRPERIEFWQGRSSRLHDRILYTRDAGGAWTRARLQP